jgi:ATP-dependent DNA helicase PIF1
MRELAQFFSYNSVSVTSFDLPLLPDSSQSPNRLIMEELSHNQQNLYTQSISLYSQLNEDQRIVYDTVLHVVCSGEHFTGFVLGHGGTGKTFLWCAVMETLRSRGHIVLAVASSGVASLLLPGRRTAHSWSRIPLDLHEESLVRDRERHKPS